MRAVRRLLEWPAARRALAATMVVASVGSIAVAAHASGTSRLTYIVGYGTSSQVVVVANVDGSAPLTLGKASAAMLSPDGTEVAALDTATTSTLSLYPSAGGVPRTLFSTHSLMQILGWSPDSKLLLLAVGATRSQLLVLDVGTTIAPTTIATGILKGASFQPGSSNSIVYSLGGQSDKGFNLFVTTPDGTPTRQLTHDGRSEFPLWGPHGIVYSHATSPPHGSAQTKGATAAPLQLWQIRPNGGAPRQLTNMTMPHANDIGLTPIGFSGDGRHLLANLVGPNWYEAYVLDLGQSKPKLRQPRDLTGSDGGTIGDAISGDGSLILATKGSVADQAALSIEEIRWAGGKPTVIAKNGAYASWNR
jgi:hypothetical protein